MRRLEHVGLAVEDLEAALLVCEQVFGEKPYKVEEVASDGVRTVFLQAGSVKLELLEALGPESPVSRFIERRGQGIHHLAFEVDSLDEEASRLEELGFTVIGEPRNGADGKRIVFLHPRDTFGVLVELCQQTTYPEVETTADGPLVYVPVGEGNDPLAHALQRHCSITREGDSSASAAAAVDPSPAWVAALSEGMPLVIIGTFSSDRADTLIIGIDSPGNVRLPGQLWTSLPDPWGLIADLAAGHLSSIQRD